MAEFMVAVETRRKQGVGTLVRCATAMGAKNLIVVGSPVYSFHGAHGADRHLPVLHFYYWADCMQYLSQIGYNQICGISTTAPSASTRSDLMNGQEETPPTPYVPLESAVFNKKVCFLVGEESGRGPLSAEQLRFCSSVIWIRLPDQSLEHLLHWDAKITLCLQQFAISHDFDKTSFTGAKHVKGQGSGKHFTPLTIMATIPAPTDGSTSLLPCIDSKEVNDDFFIEELFL